MKTYMKGRPTTSMKKGWLCRTSYDEKNREIALVDRDGRSNDVDDDPVMILSNMVVGWASHGQM